MQDLLTSELDVCKGVSSNLDINSRCNLYQLFRVYPIFCQSKEYLSAKNTKKMRPKMAHFSLFFNN